MAKLFNGGFFQSIHGCISSGKEANVYYATSDKSCEQLQNKADPRGGFSKEGQAFASASGATVFFFLGKKNTGKKKAAEDAVF